MNTNDTNSTTFWGIAIVAVAVSVLMAQGPFSIIDSCIGIMLILILNATQNINNASNHIFLKALSFVYAISYILILGIILEFILSYFDINCLGFEICDKEILFHEFENFENNDYRFRLYLRELFLVLIWFLLYFIHYKKLKNKKSIARDS